MKDTQKQFSPLVIIIIFSFITTYENFIQELMSHLE